MSAPATPARLSIREFANRAGCDEKQVRRAIEKGLLSKGDDGKLPADDVNGQWRKPNRRGIEKIAGAGVRTTANVRTAADNRGKRVDVRTDETAEQAAARIVAERPLLDLAGALQLKENYLARHQQLSYDQKAGTVVLLADVQKEVGDEYATVRRKLLAIPAEQAPAVFRARSVAEVEDVMRSVIVEALEALTLDGLPGT